MTDRFRVEPNTIILFVQIQILRIQYPDFTVSHYLFPFGFEIALDTLDTLKCVVSNLFHYKDRNIPCENGVVANAERGKPRLRTKKAKPTAIANSSSIFTTQK